MHSLWQDLKYGLRGMRRQPSFTALAVAALALGIGSVTTIFSVIENVLLNPFPYANAERIVLVGIRDTAEPGATGRTYYSVPEFLDYQEQNHVFDAMFGSSYQDV